MKATVYIPDDLVAAAGKQYHRAKRADYTMGELVRVGLTMLVGSTVPDIRAAVPNAPRRDHTPRRPDIPGLTQYQPPKSD